MATTRQIPWLRILADGTMIVVSILLAFGIDAWWSDRQLQREERLELSSVLLELQSLEEQIPSNDIYLRTIYASGRELLVSAVGSGDSLDDGDIDRLLYDITWYLDVAYLDTPELDLLISGGGLSLVSDRQLRRKLSLWPVKLSVLRSLVNRDLDFFADHLIPFLIENGSLQQIYNSSTHVPGSADEIYLTDVIDLKSPVSHRELLSNRKFQNVLTQRLSLINEILVNRPPDIQEELREIIIMIEQKIGEK